MQTPRASAGRRTRRTTRRAHRQLFPEDEGDRRQVRRPRGDLCRLHAAAGDLGPAFRDRVPEAMAAARGAKFDIEVAHPESAWVGAGEPILYRHRPALSSRRSRNRAAAEARAGLRRGIQRLGDVRRPAAGRLPRDGCAALRRRRDGRADGLCRLCRVGACPPRRRRGRFCRLRHRRDRAFLRAATRAWARCRMP